METSLDQPRPARPYPVWPTIGFVAGAVATPFCATFALAVVIGICVALHLLPATTVTVTLKRPTSLLTQGLEGVFYLTLIAWVVVGLPSLARRTLSGLGFGRQGLREWKTFLVALGLAAGVHVVEFVYLMATRQTEHQQAGFENFAPSGIAEFVAIGLMLVIVAPIAEELFFRAVIFRALAERLPLVWSALISGALFGAAHLDLVLFPLLMLLGVLGALIYARTGNLWAAIALHASNNGISFAAIVVEELMKRH